MASPWPWPGGPPHLRAPSAWALGLVYLALFLGLDWAGYIRPFQGLNITPWNPQPALAIAVLMAQPRLLWLVWLGLVLAELGVRGPPDHWWAMLGSATALSACYAAMAAVLVRRLAPGGGLDSRDDLMWLAVVSLGGALASGLAYVGIHAWAGQMPEGPWVGAVARYWVGDAVGVVVMLPALLMLLDPLRRRALAATLRRGEWWAVAGLTGVLMLAIFQAEPREAFRFFYLLFVPVIWASLRLGLHGTVPVSLLLQAGLIVGVQTRPYQDLTVFELQVLLAVLTTTGLVLGMAVEERERAAARLAGSLRLAAAGQMAAALAHELGQPLTALHTYAQAAVLILAKPTADAAQQNAQRDEAAQVAERMAAEARRASQVVKRLRDFFRSGHAQRQRAALEPLFDEAMQAAEPRRAAIGSRLVLQLPNTALPLLHVDAVQLAVVLRNLIDNALDAVAPLGAEGMVQLRASAWPDQVRIDVQDNGPGPDPQRLANLFEPGSSDKPGGMGVGLSICLALVEAHGGALWVEQGPGGHFCFSLPRDPFLSEADSRAQRHRIHRR